MLRERAQDVAVSGDPVSAVSTRAAQRGRRRSAAFVAAAAVTLSGFGIGITVLEHAQGGQRPELPAGGVSASPSVQTTSGVTPASGSPSDQPSSSAPNASSDGWASPVGLAVGKDGSLIIADAGRNQILVRKSTGQVAVLAGNGVAGYSGDGGPAAKAELNNPAGIAVGADGTVYFADSANNRVRAISPTGTIRTVAGNGATGTASDGQPATTASLLSPIAVAISPTGTVYFTSGSDVDYISADGTLHVVDAAAGSIHDPATGGPIAPAAIAFEKDGSLLVADEARKNLLRVMPAGSVSVVAPIYVSEAGLASLPDGTVVVSDYGNYAVSTVTGAALRQMANFLSLGVLASSQHVRPGGVAVGGDGTIYVADTDAAVIVSGTTSGGWHAVPGPAGATP